MPIRKNITLLLLFLTPFVFFSCRSSIGEGKGLLIEEAAIIKNDVSKISELSVKLKEAEKNNRLQNQLDLKIEQNKLILKINSALRKCSEKYSSGKSVPFDQKVNKDKFDVKEVRLIGCRFNDEIMDVEIQFMATALAVDNKDSFIQAGLLDESGKYLGNIRFLMTNDYPEKGKTVQLLSHTEGLDSFKYLTKLEF